MLESNLPLVMLVEDDAVVRRAYEQTLSLNDIRVQGYADAESALAALPSAAPALVLTDVRLPGMDGLALLRELHQLDRELPVLLMTGHGDVAMAVEAMREGAYDFIEKPFPTERLLAAVHAGMEMRALRLENRQLRARSGQGGAARLLGQSPAMQRLRHLIETLAPTGVDVLVNGETGAGKEVVARALHEASARSGAFVAINCAALPESIFESELFGHEAGAFSGAVKRRIGRIEHAHGGTLFLDEIESMSLNLQVKLLRVLQERSIERLGGNAVVPVDLRLVAASKADLRQLADSGGFRADLYYRINVVSLDLPPLRARRDDIPLLMAHFLQEAALRFHRPPATWCASDLQRWSDYAWPGNVRELRNVAERWALGLPDGLAASAAITMADASLSEQVEAYERRLIEASLAAVDGQVARAAEQLRLPKKTLYDKLARHGINAEHYRGG